MTQSPPIILDTNFPPERKGLFSGASFRQPSRAVHLRDTALFITYGMVGLVSSGYRVLLIL